MDSRALTIDSTQRRGSPQPSTGKSTKSATANSLNAFGVGNALELFAARRHQDLVPGSGIRTKAEKLQGMPVTGRGADIDLVRGRRCGFAGFTQDRKGASMILDPISIDHHYARRHFSPHRSSSADSWRDEANIIKSSEAYARLLGRPEYTQGKEWRRSMSRHRARSSSPVRAQSSATFSLARVDPGAKVGVSTNAGTLRNLVLGDWSTTSTSFSESPGQTHDLSQSLQDISLHSTPCASPPTDSPPSQMRTIRKKPENSWMTDSTSTVDTAAPRYMSPVSSPSGSPPSTSPKGCFRSMGKVAPQSSWMSASTAETDNGKTPEQKCGLTQDRLRQHKWKQEQIQLRKAQLRAGWH